MLKSETSAIRESHLSQWNNRQQSDVLSVRVGQMSQVNPKPLLFPFGSERARKPIVALEI